MKKILALNQTRNSGWVPTRRRRTALWTLAGSMAVLLLAVSLPWAAGHGASKSNKVYSLDMTRCAGFTAADAAKILNVPAASLKTKSEEMYAGLWTCSFIPARGQGVSFSVATAKSAAQAAEDMEQLRHNLEIAGGTAPFKKDVPKGAYSDISGLGDEALWTDVNGTLSVRKGNITLQVLSPSGKMEQIKVAQAFLAKF